MKDIFEVVCILGQGAWGTTLLVNMKKNNKPLAIKMIKMTIQIINS